MFKKQDSTDETRLAILEAKVNVILIFTGGQFLGFIALVITLITHLS